MLIEGIVSRFQQKLGNLATAALRLTPGTGSLAVALAEGEGDEVSRAGTRFHLHSSAATGIAPVQALPTTAAQWLFYNPASSPVNVFFDLIGVWLVSGTAGAGATVLAAVCKAANVPATRPAASSAGIVLTNANPVSPKSSQLIVVASQTLQGAPGFKPLAWMNPAGTILGQTQMESADLKGRFMLAPDTGLALAVISPTGTTPLFAPYGIYREYAGDVE